MGSSHKNKKCIRKTLNPQIFHAIRYPRLEPIPEVSEGFLFSTPYEKHCTF